LVSEPTLPPAPPGRAGWPWNRSEIKPLAPADNLGAWPRISIVTPSYNQAPYLEEALRSVLLQDYPNLEYFVQDGGSRDESAGLIEKYAPWLAGWVSETDRGQSHAINKGLAHASGEIFGWLNSDDLYLPGALRAAAAAFREHPEVILVHGEAEHISRDGTLLPYPPAARPYNRRWLLEQSNLIPQPAAFFRASAFRQAGGLDESLHYAMDWDLWLRLEAEGRAIFLPQVLARMRIYPEAKFQAGGQQMHTELRRIIKRHGGQGLPAAVRERLAAEQMALALDCYQRGDAAGGRRELAYLIENQPAWRSDAETFAQAIAGQAWRLHLDKGIEPWALIKQLRLDLPELAEQPDQVQQHTLGLLHEAYALHHFGAGKTGLTVQHAWAAARSDGRQWRNRGLWSVAIRAVLGQGGKPTLAV
jgi:hypothetical protein